MICAGQSWKPVSQYHPTVLSQLQALRHSSCCSNPDNVSYRSHGGMIAGWERIKKQTPRAAVSRWVGSKPILAPSRSLRSSQSWSSHQQLLKGGPRSLCFGTHQRLATAILAEAAASLYKPGARGAPDLLRFLPKSVGPFNPMVHGVAESKQYY